ncbi:tRNA lysidine(34) synthetase TilS [Leptolyngbya sp. AN02str]|uniref:tRNA lysidine(34) synthetase TilS n=1 Tax=Leptolyngbya sp. AN02str TaxID=3423363 RepID=UPI003D319BF5
MPNASSWTPLHARLHQTLLKRQLLPPGQGILVAVSGGQDSLCLLKLLRDLQPKWEWTLGVAHCNHGWRNDAHANAAHVETFAQSWNLPYEVAIAPSMLPTTEAAARDWRYQALIEMAQVQGYSYLVTGHTASDRAETLLHNLMRGSGADGLQALTWRRSLTERIQLIRPLLNTTRQETGKFCQEHGISIWEDTTNSDRSYARNRIRLDLLPYLQTHFNPKVEHHLSQTAELLQADVAYLEAEASRLLAQAIAPSGKPAVNRRILHSAATALQRRALRQFLQMHLPNHPNFEQVGKLHALITAPNRSQTDPLPKGAIARVEGDWIVLTTL